MKNRQHEVFALTVFEAVRRMGHLGSTSKRQTVVNAVVRAMKVLDSEKVYGQKMVDYVTDSVCSYVGIED